MPLTGRFAIDFADLYVGVQRAELSLKSFTAEGAKVEKQLNRVADSLSGHKLIQDATLMAGAVEKLGGVSRLTADEQARVNKVVQDAIDKYRALGEKAPHSLTSLAEATRKVEESTSRTSKFLGDLTDHVVATAAGFVTAQAAIGLVERSFGSLTRFVGDSITAYAHAEAASKKMTTALTAQGTATPGVVGHMNDLASEFQRTTVYSDDLINEMEALFTQIGNVGPAEMGKALTAATDLASGLGIDLQTATTLVGKAFEGETGTLKRYGIVIDDAKLKTQGATAVMDAIRAKFGGQAAAEVDTYAGRVKQLANEWDNFKEAVGEVVVTSPILTASLRVIQDRITGGTQAVVDHDHSWSNLLRNLNIFGKDAPNIVADTVRHLEDLAKTSNTVAAGQKLMADMLDKGSFETRMEGDLAAASAQKIVDAQRAKEAADKLAAEASKKAKEAAEAHAKAIQGLRDILSGGGAIRAAREMMEALRGTIPIQQMTKEAQENINKTMDAAIEVYRAQGKVAPQTMRDLWIATQPAIDVVTGLGQAFSSLGESIKVDIPAIHEWVIAIKDGISEMPGLRTAISIPKAQKGLFASLFGDPKDFGEQIAGAIQGAIQGGGNVASAAAGFVGTKIGSHISESLLKNGGKFFQGALGEVFAGTIPVIGSLIGPLAGAIWDKLFGSAGRDAVKNFASSFGGFDALHKQLNALGAAGEQLWIKLTQGVGKNNPEQAKAVIDEITKALDAQKAKAAEAGEAAAAQAGTVTEANQKALDAIKAMNDEMQGLFDSIKDEAPEEVMGVVERQTRDKIAAIQKERDAAQQAMTETTSHAAEAAKEAGEQIDAALKARQFVIRVRAQVEGLDGLGATSGIRGGPTPQIFHEAAGGDFLVTRPTLFLAGEAGPERATFSGGGRTGASTDGQPLHNVIQIDGLTLIEAWTRAKKRYVG